MSYFIKVLSYLCLCFYFLQSGFGSSFPNSRNHTLCELCVTWLPEEFDTPPKIPWHLYFFLMVKIMSSIILVNIKISNDIFKSGVLVEIVDPCLTPRN